MKEPSEFDSPKFKRELDEYWGPAMVNIERAEYLGLMDDSAKLAEIEDALIDLINRVKNITPGLKKATGGL